MTALVKLNYRSPKVRTWVLNPDSPDYEFEYWMAGRLEPNALGNWEVPGWFEVNFCRVNIDGKFFDHKACGLKRNEVLNFMCCETCQKPKIYQWPLFIFECDGCEKLFMIKRWPIHYQLCQSCGGG